MTCRKLCFLLCIALYGNSSIQGQQVPKNYTPPSPDASSLGIYTAIPVNYYSGIPGISIPFHDVEIKNLSMPVGLSYYSGGVRQSEEAGCVGLGWSLNAGGVITRVKRHKDDFSEKGYFKVRPPESFFNFPRCNESFDQEPDLFCFNFAGRGGKFIITSNTNGAPVVKMLVKEQLKFSLSATGGWIVIDEFGNRFEFEKKEYSYETSTGPGGTQSETYVSTWYLTKIQNLFGEVITFNYYNYSSRIQKQFQSYSTRIYSGTSPYDVFIFSGYCINGQPASVYAGQYFMQTSLGFYTTVHTDLIYLNSIEFPDGKIEFLRTTRSDLDLQNTSMQAFKVDQVKLYSKANQEISRLHFAYDYFLPSSGSTNPKLQRLRLVSIQEKAGGLEKTPYQFEYTTPTIEDKGNTSRLGGFTPRLGDGLLQKITYPTGGYTQYEYEPHAENAGARIKAITQFDGIRATNAKQYEYAGSKLLVNSHIGFVSTLYTVAINGLTFCGNGFAVTGYAHYQNIHSSDQNLLGESSSDYIVGYDQVVELENNNGINGKTVYTFYNDNAVITASGINGVGVPAWVPNRNGSLKSREIFSYKNGSFVPVEKQVTHIDAIQDFALSPGRWNGSNCNSVYSVNGDWLRTSSTQEYAYDKNGQLAVATTTNYTYGYTGEIRPSGMDVEDSKGNTVSTHYKYVPQKAQEAGGVYATMVDKNFISPVIEETQKINGTQLTRTINNYRNWTVVPGGLIALETQQFQKGSAAVKTKVRFERYDANGNPLGLSKENDIPTAYIWGYRNKLPIAEASNASAGDIGFTSFEDIGERYFGAGDYALQYLTTQDSHSGKKSLECQAGTNMNVIAQYFLPAQKGKYVFSCWAKTPPGFEGGYLAINTSSVNSPGIRYPVNAESYRMSLITGTNGTWKYFEVVIDLDKVKQLSGVTEDLTLAVYIMNNDNDRTFLIDDLRFHPASARMTTYTYDPLVGMTSECDANNQIIYYEYDSLNRLIYVRDRKGNVLKKICYSYTGQPETCGN